MKALSRAIAPFLVAWVVAACSSTTTNTRSGIPNTQPSQACIKRQAHCSFNSDCCSQFCANGVCASNPNSS